MSASAPRPKFSLKNPVIEGPIASFPEDVGWFAAYRKPLPVRARKMGVFFAIHRDGEDDSAGHPGDYVVVINDGMPILVDGGTFDERYSRESLETLAPAPPTPPTPAVPEMAVDEPWTEDRKASVEAAVHNLLTSSEAKMQEVIHATVEKSREFVADLTAQQVAVKVALDATTTTPVVYTCVFCKEHPIESPSRQELLEHAMRDHLMKGLFGDLDKKPSP